MKKDSRIEIRCTDKVKTDFTRVTSLLGQTPSEAIFKFMIETIGLENEILQDVAPAKPLDKQKPIAIVKDVSKNIASGQGDGTMYKDEFGIWRRK